jgi:hypothetical protein
VHLHLVSIYQNNQNMIRIIAVRPKVVLGWSYLFFSWIEEFHFHFSLTMGSCYKEYPIAITFKLCFKEILAKWKTSQADSSMEEAAHFGSISERMLIGWRTLIHSGELLFLSLLPLCLRRQLDYAPVHLLCPRAARHDRLHWLRREFGHVADEDLDSCIAGVFWKVRHCSPNVRLLKTITLSLLLRCLSCFFRPRFSPFLPSSGVHLTLYDAQHFGIATCPRRLRTVSPLPCRFPSPGATGL